MYVREYIYILYELYSMHITYNAFKPKLLTIKHRRVSFTSKFVDNLSKYQNIKIVYQLF